MRTEVGEWLERRYLDWQKEQGGRQTVTKFAEWLGVSRDIVNKWLNGTLRPGDKYADLLADKLGPEIYDVLGRPRPDDRLEKIISVWGRLPEAVRLELVERAEQGAETGNDNAASGEVPSGVAAPKRGSKK